MTDPWGRPPQQPGPSQPFPPNAPQNPDPGVPPGPPPDSSESSLPAKLKKTLSDPLSVVLVVVIVLALVFAGVLGTELYARHRADSIVAGVVGCVVQDEAEASFGVLPPFVVQHVSGHYTNIRVKTAGNQIRDAKGMKVELDINDVRLGDANSPGSIGSLVAHITWSAEGIKQTIQGAVPLVGTFVNSVTTNPSDGTIELEGALGSITTRPQVIDGGLTLQVQQVTGLGFTLPREIVQPALDAFTADLTENYPLDIKADSVEVTDSGVVSQFSASNAAIEQQGPSQDPCFSQL